MKTGDCDSDERDSRVSRVPLVTRENDNDAPYTHIEAVEETLQTLGTLHEHPNENARRPWNRRAEMAALCCRAASLSFPAARPCWAANPFSFPWVVVGRQVQ